jgi:hypothetical protein
MAFEYSKEYRLRRHRWELYGGARPRLQLLGREFKSRINSLPCVRSMGLIRRNLRPGPGLPLWPSFRDSRDTVMFLGDQLRTEAIPGERNLKRLDRIYATATFVSRHLYWTLALGIFLVCAVLVVLVMGYRSWARRRRERIARMRQLHA